MFTGPTDNIWKHHVYYTYRYIGLELVLFGKYIIRVKSCK